MLASEFRLRTTSKPARQFQTGRGATGAVAATISIQMVRLTVCAASIPAAPHKLNVIPYNGCGLSHRVGESGGNGADWNQGRESGAKEWRPHDCPVTQRCHVHLAQEIAKRQGCERLTSQTQHPILLPHRRFLRVR